jgi:hypothetical protein
MSFVSQWKAIAERLPADWSDAQLLVTIESDAEVDRAAALLGPASPGRSASHLRRFSFRSGPGLDPHALARALGRLDQERVWGRLELVGNATATTPPETERKTLAATWDEALATLPPDWSDLHAELELTSTDHLDRAALLTSPLNPSRFAETPGFRFRVARRSGYGVSPSMARRCLERMDEEDIPGQLRVLRVLSDTHNVLTQGPVWRVEGAAV